MMRRGLISRSNGTTMAASEQQRRMHQQQHRALKLWRLVWLVQLILVFMVAIVMATSVLRLYSAGFFAREHLHIISPHLDDDVQQDLPHKEQQQLQKQGMMVVSRDQMQALLLDIVKMQRQVGEVMVSIHHDLQAQEQDEQRSKWLEQSNLLSQIAALLDETKNTVRRLMLNFTISATTTAGGGAGAADQGGFAVDEMNKYVLSRENRLGSGKKNFLGSNATHPSVGLACTAGWLKQDVEKYMSYSIGDYCPDDWPLAQRLMVHGCDPLPRRRCLARSPQLYQAPLSMKSSIWSIPDDRNIRWNNYRCKNLACLKSRNSTSTKGFYKCSECFDFQGAESQRWVFAASASINGAFTAADFRIDEVLGVKPEGDIRIGLDFSVGTGTFAARMQQRNVTIVSATLNLGAPFNEVIALRGLVPLYLSINQRLPFFDNTLDMVHTTLFLDGWIDHTLLDFILFDWDRVLRPGGLLWIDRFFCLKDDLEDYLYFFLQLHYKKHLWVVAPKLDRHGKEVFFSALLEKPTRPY